MITCDLEKDERMGWSTRKVRVDGLSICGITDKTDPAAVAQFLKLCEENELLLKHLVKESDKAREWNTSHPGQGKDWPAFKNLEKFRAKLLKQAGVHDS